MSKAKKHPLLGEVSAAIGGRLPETTVNVLGHKYVLRLLKPEGDDWANARTEGGTLSAALLNIRKPTIAASLVSIDDVLVEQLFQPGDDMDEKIKEALFAENKFIRDWRREQALEWLREEANNFIVDELYSAYTKMQSKHREELQNFQKGTTSLN